MVGRGLGLPAAGPTTRRLCGLLVAVSVLFRIAGRKLGPGGEWLVFDVERLQAGELWRLLTYPFVEGDPLSLLLSAAGLYFLGAWYEARVGSRAMLRFFAASSVGGALLAVVFHFLLNSLGLFVDRGSAEGPQVVIDAMLVALALEAPESRVMFGFILPLPARTVVWLLVGVQLLFALMQGQAAVSITLGGMAMGWLLFTGRWNPRLWRRRRVPLRARRSDIYIVRPQGRDLH